MGTNNSKVFRRFNFVVDLILTAFAFFLADFIASSRIIHLIEPATISNRFSFFILPLWSLFLLSFRGSYNYRFRSSLWIAQGLLFPLAKAFILLLGLSFLFKFGKNDRITLFIFLGFDFLFLWGFRMVMNLLLTSLQARGYGLKKVLLVGSGQMAKDYIKEVKRHPEWGVKIIGGLDWEENHKGRRYLGVSFIGTLASLESILKNNQIDCVIYAVPSKFMDFIRECVLLCEKMGVMVNIIADYFCYNPPIKRSRNFESKPVIAFHTGSNKSLSLILKGILDRALALIGILFFSPIMLGVALLIKFTSPGPLLFKQKRCGLNNKRFTFYKFRTMVENAEELKKNLLERNEMDGAAFKIKDDPRITKVGKYLRKFSLDELPQLFNVLLGNISLVGPRPPLLQEVSQYQDWQRRRLSVKPGITCLWQISGRNEIGFKQWMEMDLEYIDNWSFKLDLKILFKTIPAVILTRGAR